MEWLFIFVILVGLAVSIREMFICQPGNAPPSDLKERYERLHADDENG